jgi:hypothetical protein
MKISNRRIKATHYFFDGCHKIYLIEDDQDKQNFFNMGWTELDIYPINTIIDTYECACPLKFIQTCKLKTIVPQAVSQVTFTTDTEKITIRN